MSAPNKKELRLRAAITEALAPHGFPTPAGAGLCFDAAGDDAFQRGWPCWRTLTDDAVPPAKAIDAAEKGLDALDRTFGRSVPRDIARRYLLGYCVGPGLFVDANHPAENAARRAERAEAIRSDREVDVALLEQTLARQARSLGEVYAWRWPKVLFLYEAFLGPEPVARAVVQHLVAAAGSEQRFGAYFTDRYRDNTCLHHIASALPWLLVRSDPRVREELRTALRSVSDPDTVGDAGPQAFLAQLRSIGGESATPHPSALMLYWNLALAYGDTAVVQRFLDMGGHHLLWDVARVCWVFGTAPLARTLALPGHDLPWMLESLAPIRDPGVVRLMAHLAALGATKKEAGAWLRAHAEYAGPIIESLSTLDDKKEQRAVAAARAALESSVPIMSTTPPTPEEAEVEIARIFAVLGKALASAKSPAKKKAAIRDAYDSYVEVQAASGHPTPEAYFTHRFDDFGLGEHAMLAVDAID